MALAVAPQKRTEGAASSRQSLSIYPLRMRRGRIPPSYGTLTHWIGSCAYLLAADDCGIGALDGVHGGHRVAVRFEEGAAGGALAVLGGGVAQKGDGALDEAGVVIADAGVHAVLRGQPLDALGRGDHRHAVAERF